MGWWMVPGVHAVPVHQQTATEFIKIHPNPKQFEIEARLLGIANAAGCAPDFKAEPPNTLRLRLHETLDNWLGRAGAGERRAMARLVLDQARRLHAAGVCTRDLKPDDVVVADGCPLIVDYDLGTVVDANGACYDLVGPASGIPLPAVHKTIGLIEGVWWDSPTHGVRPMWRVLGRVSETDAERAPQ